MKGCKALKNHARCDGAGLSGTLLHRSQGKKKEGLTEGLFPGTPRNEEASRPQEGLKVIEKWRIPQTHKYHLCSWKLILTERNRRGKSLIARAKK